MCGHYNSLQSLKFSEVENGVLTYTLVCNADNGIGNYGTYRNWGSMFQEI